MKKIILLLAAAALLSSCFPWKEERTSTVISKRYESLHEWEVHGMHTTYIGKVTVSTPYTNHYWIESCWFVTLEQRIQEADAKVKTGEREYEISKEQYHALRNGKEIKPVELDRRSTSGHSGRVPFGTVVVPE